MNLNRYEKIDGWQALEHLKNNELVTREIDGYTLQTKLIGGLLFEKEPTEEDFDICDIVLNELIESNWYIPKPFDVRQAMLERPNEWVGAFKPAAGRWMKVGFNELRFGVSVRPLKEDGVYLPSHGSNDGYGVTESQLNKCIPIEDAPDESKLYGMKPSVAICDEEANQ